MRGRQVDPSPRPARPRGSRCQAAAAHCSVADVEKKGDRQIGGMRGRGGGQTGSAKKLALSAAGEGKQWGFLIQGEIG